MADPIIRPRFSLAMFKTEATEGVDSGPTIADAFPFESDSFNYTDPYTAEDSAEAVASLVSAQPRIVGQPVTMTFRCRLKGANQAYTALIRPPHHALFQACGKRGLFTAATLAATATAGTTTAVTLNASASALAQALRGMPLVVGSGANNGRSPLVVDYTTGRVATLAEVYSPAFDATSGLSVPANWTYAGTSPLSVAQRATDHPSGTLYYYEDGLLVRLFGCRGSVTFSGQSKAEGFAEFRLTGIWGGRVDATIPSGAAIPAQGGPVLLQGSSSDAAFVVNRQPLPIGQWSYDDSVTVENPDDPNTTGGFDPGVIGSRAPRLTCDPLLTTVATRDTIADILNATTFSAALRLASTTVGNRVSFVWPRVQRVGGALGTRGALRSESLVLRATSPGLDPNTRDGDMILCFY